MNRRHSKRIPMSKKPLFILFPDNEVADWVLLDDVRDSGECWHCNKMTPVIDITYATFLCSTECANEKHKEIAADLKALNYTAERT